MLDEQQVTVVSLAQTDPFARYNCLPFSVVVVGHLLGHSMPTPASPSRSPGRLDGQASVGQLEATHLISTPLISSLLVSPLF